jgi:hypothetical protein
MISVRDFFLGDSEEDPPPGILTLGLSMQIENHEHP